MPPWTWLSHLGSCKYLCDNNCFVNKSTTIFHGLHSYRLQKWWICSVIVKFMFHVLCINIWLLFLAWNFFPNRARSHWLLWGHLTSNNESTVSRQNLWAGNVAKSLTSEGNSALLPTNVYPRLLLQWDLMNFQLQTFQLYNKSLKDWSLGKQLILFPSNLNVSLGSTLGKNRQR